MRRRSSPDGSDPALPAPVAGWPVVAWEDPQGDPLEASALERIRAERLWWPVVRDDADDRIGADLSGVDPDLVDPEAWPQGHQAHRMLALARGDLAALPRIRWVCPWRGHRLKPEEGLAALSFLSAAARANRRPCHLVGMSPWKRRCVAPFLAGPHGRPGRAAAAGSRPVSWGSPGAEPAPDPDALWVEDGFLRSVGLGLRHVPPLSLVVGPHPPYFDATRRNGFEEAVAGAAFTPDVLARAARLRARVLELRLSKYNLGGPHDGLHGGPHSGLPTAPPGREALLVVGQVESDASLSLGGTGVRTNIALLRAAREAYPKAFLLYKPHPDVLTGLRDGGDRGEAGQLADHVECVASAPDCIDWADRVVTITSLMGFEALLRGTPVTTFGRPFYSGWGLTDDRDPPARDRHLSLDALTAAALILYPRYIDPVSGLPAPPELVVEAVAAERDAPASVSRTARRLWRSAISWAMNSLPRGAG